MPEFLAFAAFALFFAVDLLIDVIQPLIPTVGIRAHAGAAIPIVEIIIVIKIIALRFVGRKVSRSARARRVVFTFAESVKNAHGPTVLAA